MTCALADYGEQTAAASPGCRAQHIDWPAWAGEALGERSDLAEAMISAGLRPDAGQRRFAALAEDARDGRTPRQGRDPWPRRRARPAADRGHRHDRPERQIRAFHRAGSGALSGRRAYRRGQALPAERSLPARLPGGRRSDTAADDGARGHGSGGVGPCGRASKAGQRRRDAGTDRASLQVCQVRRR